jgi:hypothetical protein
MLTLAVLLQIAGLIFTFSLGTTGYVIGPLTVVAGAWLYRREQKRRREFAANPPGGCACSSATPRRMAAFSHWPERRSSWHSSVCSHWFGRLTAGLATTADEFFLALKAEDFEKARTYLAEDFRAATSEQELRDFVARSALSNYASASWSSRSIENSTGTLEGVVETVSGGSIPMSISLVREQGDWKIYTLRKLDAGIQSLQSGATPSVPDQVRLVRATTHDFADAVARRDFTAFHANAASMCRSRSRRTNC